MKRSVELLMRFGMALAFLGFATALAPPVQAQSDLFAPAVTVNGTVITRYEVAQRRAFLTVLNQQGDLAQMAMDGLISDRLQMDAAKHFGVTISPDDIKAGMDEFAARGNLTTEEFLNTIAQAEVEPQTFRDFVKAGILWRQTLRAKFGGQIHVTDAEVDRAIAAGAASGGALRLLLSEIVLVDDGKTDVAGILQRIRDKVKSAADFATEASLFSKVNTAANGGALDWIEVTALPPDVAAALTALKPGEMSQLLPQPGAKALYFLRDVSVSSGPAKSVTLVDYAVFVPPVGADLVRLHASLNTCGGLNTAARGLPVEALQRQTVPEAALPPALRGPIAGLDAGESVILTASNGAAELVMLCARTPQSLVAASRDDVRNTLVNKKVTLLASTYLEELRSDAIIVQQ